MIGVEESGVSSKLPVEPRSGIRRHLEADSDPHPEQMFPSSADANMRIRDEWDASRCEFKANSERMYEMPPSKT
jgi:hypothetical protein